MKVFNSLIFILLAQTLVCQNIGFNTLNSKDGLSNNYVTSIDEGNSGFFCIGPGDGFISKFNPSEISFTGIKIDSELVSLRVLGIIKNTLKSNSIFISGKVLGLFEHNRQTKKLSNLYHSSPTTEIKPILNIKGLGLNTKTNYSLLHMMPMGLLCIILSIKQYTCYITNLFGVSPSVYVLIKKLI